MREVDERLPTGRKTPPMFIPVGLYIYTRGIGEGTRDMTRSITKF